jgi:hypothetical protein
MSDEAAGRRDARQHSPVHFLRTYGQDLAHPFRESHRSPVNVRGHQAIEVPALVNARAGHPSLRAV